MFDGLSMLGFVIAIGALALAVIAWQRATRLEGELSRVKRLVRDLDRDLGALERQAEGTASPPPLPVTATSASLPKTDGPDTAPKPPPPPRKPARPKPPAPVPIDWEKFIGRRVLGWVAVALVLLAASFFIKYAFDTIFGPTARITTGAVIGLALCLLGGRSGARGGSLACSMFCSAGLLILYLSVYAAFGYYTLIPPGTGGALLAAIMAEGVLLSLLYRARPLAYLALAGALVVPVIIPAQEDRYAALFIYLAVVNIVSALLTRSVSHPFLRLLSYLGSQLLFWVWFAGHYHPEKMVAVIGFQAGLYAVWMLAGRFGRVRVPDAERVIMWLATALCFFLVLHRIVDEEAVAWRGVLALAFAIVYAVFVRLALVLDDRVRLATLTALSLGFLGAAIPLQTEAPWTAVTWAVIGTTLWWFGLRIRSELLRAGGVVFLAGSLVGVVAAWVSYDGVAITVPVFNRRSMPLLGVAACLLGVAIATRRLQDRMPRDHSTVRNLAALAAAFLVWIMLSWETLNTGEQLFQMSSMENQTALSVVWALYAAVLLAAGFWLRRPMVRWTGLGLLVVTVLKLIGYDLSELPAILRALTFLAAAVVSALAAWAYQRLTQAGKEADHE